MKLYPTALELLSEEIEGMRGEIQKLSSENFQLRQQLVTANASYSALFKMSLKEVLLNYESDVLSELAEQLAPVFGLTKSEHYRERIKEFLESQKKKIIVESIGHL